MILNKTKNSVISNEEIICYSTYSQIRGLMFKSRKNIVMKIKNVNPKYKFIIHNFFVFFSTDILLLDENLKIIEIKRCFKPFHTWKPASIDFKYIIELSTPSFYKIGDVLEII